MFLTMATLSMHAKDPPGRMASLKDAMGRSMINHHVVVFALQPRKEAAGNILLNQEFAGPE